MTDSRSLPDQAPVYAGRRVLHWIFVARLAISAAIFGTALFVGEGWRYGASFAGVGIRPLAAVTLVAVIVVTALAYWTTHRRPETPELPLVHGQAAFDVLLVSVIVLVTGGSLSALPPLLYIALVSGYALITPLQSGVLIALATGFAYLAVIGGAYPGQLGLPVVIQVVIFTIVAVVSGIIGGKLREVGEVLTSVEGELRKLRFGTSDILRTIDAAVITVDSEGRAVYLNPAAAELFDLSAEEWIGSRVLEPLRAKAPGVTQAMRETLAGRQIRGREVEILEPDGITLPFSVSTALLDRPGRRPLANVVLQDLRMARQLEELHLRASRLGVVAELSASLAHEIKNPLASIRSAVEQIAEADADGEDREMLTRLIVRETDRLARLLGEFNDFARVSVAARKPIALSRMIDEALEVVCQVPGAKGRAKFEVEIDSALDDLWGDPDLVHRTLTNLVLNAVQVSEPDLVTVRIVVDSLSPDLVPAGLASGMPVRIRVIDDGPGVAPEDLGRIFDPFYTRREGGSGMGLAIAHRAVQAHGGALLVSSTLGEGATFAIILPRRDPQARERFSRKGGPESLRHAARDPYFSRNDAEEAMPALDGFVDRLG